eukprot:g45811.t1
MANILGKSDDNTVFLLPAYKQKLNGRILHEVKYSAGPSQQKIVSGSAWTSMDWTMFKCSAKNMDEYATTVSDFIKKCVEDCIPKKSIRVFPNAGNDTSFPDMLNVCYAWFEQNTTGVAMPVSTAPDTPVPSVTTSDVRSVFLGVNPRNATGPGSVPGRALRSSVDQLAEVFTDIFNLSLLQAEVPTCFKKTTIIPVTKKAYAVYLYDYCPKALTAIIMKCFKRLIMAPSTPVSQLSSIPYSLPIDIIDPQRMPKTKELIIDFRKKGGEYAPIDINGTELERVKSIKFLGVTITDDLSWISHDCKKLQKVVCTDQTITETNLPSMESIYTAHYHGKAANIIKDPSHP